MGRVVATIAFAVLLLGVAVAGAGAAAIVGAVMVVNKDLDALHKVVLPVPNKTTKIFAADGELLAELYLENREYIPYQKIPDNLKNAFLAIEDDKFYYHKGVNIKAVFRATFANMTSGAASQGGSTITQQLARNIYLTHEKTIARKLKEALLAIAIEKKYSKEEILESYLNLIYFGHGAYGVKTAAKTYFDKDLPELTVAECALLAGLPQSPNRISPFNNMERAVTRRNIVLKEMLEHDFIDRAAYLKAKSEPIVLAALRPAGYASYKAPYFVTYVTDLLTDPEGPFDYTWHTLYSQGLNVYTTLDMQSQTAAEAAVKEALRLSAEKKKNVSQSAAIVMDPHTGAIMAMVGGKDFGSSKFNRITQAHRQPGSLFKAFVYITAVENGYRMSDLTDDRVRCYPDNGRPWCPKNYDNKQRGVMTLATALKLSRNVPAVKMLARLGPDKVIATARKMGVASPLERNLSIALGTSEMTPLEVIAAFSELANGGFKAPPSAVVKVENPQHALLYEAKPAKGARILAQETIAEILPVMEMVVKEGTGTRARLDDRPVAGKTGTTSDFRDAWFCGFTPTRSGLVWIGNDNNSAMGSGVTGGGIPAPAWKLMMERALKGTPPGEFDYLLPPTAFLPPSQPEETEEPADPSGNAPETNVLDAEGAPVDAVPGPLGKREPRRDLDLGQTMWIKELAVASREEDGAPGLEKRP